MMCENMNSLKANSTTRNRRIQVQERLKTVSNTNSFTKKYI